MHLLKLVIVLFVSCVLSARAEIYSAETVEEINNSIMDSLSTRNAEKALVILPLEGFFAEPVDSAFYKIDDDIKPLVEKSFKKIKLSKRRFMNELILTEYQQRLSDQMIPDFIKNIQDKKTPIIVVTRNVSGSFNKIPYLEVWAWQYIMKNGVDLAKSPIGTKQILLNKSRKKQLGSYPTFYKGLLSCNTVEQANSPQSLIVYLLSQELKWLPDIVYIVDKNEEYIKSIVQQFKVMRKDIQVEGFVYLPKAKTYKDLSNEQIIKFWDNLVTKLNNADKKELDKKNEDPYEQ
ncbi:MAG: DUF2608 domain-containing protein [Rickettsiales bacterium]|nr:DUF2608 domain-containing protein [Rickettsiales bacterium]MCA0254452.1 hypothetical protein [Pseudomonadota bacterium]